MLKTLTLFSVLSLTCFTAQAQDLLDTIAIQTCNCMSQLADDTTRTLTEIQMGVCLLEEARPYGKRLLEEYQINIQSVESEGMTRLGEIVGMRMVSHCIELIMLFAGEDEPAALPSIRGGLKDISGDEFMTLIVVDDSGRRHTLLWLHYFTGSDALLGDKSALIGSKVRIDYEEQEFFDVQIHEYRNYKILRAISFE